MKIVLTIINGLLLITVPLLTCAILALGWIILVDEIWEYVKIDMVYKFVWLLPVVIVLKVIKHQLKVNE